MLKYLFKDPQNAIPIFLYNQSNESKLITIIRSRTDDLIVEALSDNTKKWKIEGMSNIINFIVNNKKAIDQDPNADKVFWLYSKLDVSNPIHINYVQNLIKESESLLAFVIFAKLRTNQNVVNSFPEIKQWFDGLESKYSVKVEDFINSNSGALVNTAELRDKKPKEKKIKDAPKKKQETNIKAVEKKEKQPAKKKDEVSDEYKAIVKSQVLYRIDKE